MRLPLGFFACLAGVTCASEVILGVTESEVAPHGKGNVYAPEIRKVGEAYWMWYGGQGRDGHDRIHLAVSVDGKSWVKRGVVFEKKEVNHVNDPSVVVADGRYYLYYTQADSGVTDVIGLAVSEDGVRWEDRGVVFRAGRPGSWDGYLVGRPSVLYERGRFRMWYDGRKDLPEGAPDADAPKSAHSVRWVGYAESDDGIEWKRHLEPVYGDDAGGVHVRRAGGRLVMVYESREGTKWAESRDGIRWKGRGVLAEKRGAPEAFGHVTPFLWAGSDGGRALYFGAARARGWNENFIARRPFAGE